MSDYHDPAGDSRVVLGQTTIIIAYIMVIKIGNVGIIVLQNWYGNAIAIGVKFTQYLVTMNHFDGVLFSSFLCEIYDFHLTILAIVNMCNDLTWSTLYVLCHRLAILS